MSTITSASVHNSVPAYTLFDSNSVAAATFLGTPVAGATLMALNYKRLGQGAKAAVTLLLGTIVSAVLVLLAWSLPRAACSIIALALLFLIQRIAQALQGPAVKQQVELGGRLGSRWTAFGLGAAFFAVLFGIIMAVVMAADNMPKVIVGTKDEVFYSGSATKEEATALGNVLKQSGFFTDKGTSVILNKEQNKRTLSFVVKDGAWDQPATVSLFDEVGRQVAPTVGGLPVQVRLLNTDRDVKEESTVGKVAFGKDTIYYVGTATEAEALAVGKALTADGFFHGRGSDVFLSKHKDGTVLSFVVSDGAWDDPAILRDFERIGRKVGSAVGILPLRLHLVSTSLDVKKEEWIR